MPSSDRLSYRLLRSHIRRWARHRMANHLWKPWPGARHARQTGVGSGAESAESAESGCSRRVARARARTHEHGQRRAQVVIETVQPHRTIVRGKRPLTNDEWHLHGLFHGAHTRTEGAGLVVVVIDSPGAIPRLIYMCVHHRIGATLHETLPRRRITTERVVHHKLPVRRGTVPHQPCQGRDVGGGGGWWVGERQGLPSSVAAVGAPGELEMRPRATQAVRMRTHGEHATYSRHPSRTS